MSGRRPEIPVLAGGQGRNSRPFLENNFHLPLKWVKNWVLVNLPNGSKVCKKVGFDPFSPTHFLPIFEPFQAIDKTQS